MTEKLNVLEIGIALAAVKKETKKISENLFEALEDIQSTPGKDGSVGPTGKVGPMGLPGPRGETGADGVDGQEGKPGETGPEGIQGPQGVQGEPGETGAQGPKGDQGSIGPQGEEGPKGEIGGRGPKGDRGDVGPQGETGEKGEAGIAGQKGEPGETGERGETGPQGEQGLRGEPGPAGHNGHDGKDVDRKELDKYVKELFDSAKQSLDAQQVELNEVLDTAQTSELEQFKKKITKDVSDNIEKHKKFIDAQISSKWASSAGGGSVNILQMDDVEFKKRHQVEGDAILIFDETKQKFISESFNDIIERLQVGMEVQYDRLVDTEGDFIYIGEAVPGTARDAAAWRIKRVYELAGDDIEIIWANNTANTELVWDDRYSYEYS